MRQAFAIILALPLGLSGCAHAPLERNANRQAPTITDIQFNQVLTNIAMFIENPDTMPFSSPIGTGTTQVVQSGEVDPSLTWQAHKFTMEMLGLKAMQNLQENWTLAPVHEADRLDAMRCAYQQLVTGVTMTEACKNKVLKYTKRPIKGGWFECGRCRDIPRDACYVGHCHKTYVWVLAGDMDELSNFTMAILDIATAIPPSPPMKVVVTEEYKYDKDDKTLKKVIKTTTTEPAKAISGPGGAAPPEEPKQYKNLYNPLGGLINLR